MPEGNRVSVSYRVPPKFQLLLKQAAKRENRSQTNFLEQLVYDYCKRNGIEVEEPVAAKKKGNA